MKRLLPLLALAGALLGCQRSETPAPAPASTTAPGTERPLTIGLAFENVSGGSFWAAGLDALRAEVKKRNFTAVEGVANGDPKRQLEQVLGFINRRVDGIVLVPRDTASALPLIKAANLARIPIVLFNRPVDAAEVQSTAVVVDNLALAKETAEHLLTLPREAGRRHRAVLLLGDPADASAAGRRDGFEAAVKEHAAAIEVAARIPAHGDPEKVQSDLRRTLQENPDISLIFASQDAFLPAVVSVLKGLGRFRPVGTPGHVTLGSFDGDPTAYQMINDGFLDATGVADVTFQARLCVQAVADLRAGRSVPVLLRDPGFVLHPGNVRDRLVRVWGAVPAKQ